MYNNKLLLLFPSLTYFNTPPMVLFVGYGASSGFDERGWGHKDVCIYSFLSFCFVVNTNTEHVLHMWFASWVRCHSFAL